MNKVHVHGLFFVAILSLAYTQLINGKSLPGCKDRCGNVTIEYPFGLSPDCCYGGYNSFRLTCNETTNKLSAGSMQVINYSHSGELRVLKSRSLACYNSTQLTRQVVYTTSLANLTLSNKNRFTAVGCNTYAVMTTVIGDRNYSTGCLSLCDSTPKESGICSGEGCCHTSVPKRSSRFIIRSRRFDNKTSVNEFNPCFFAFLVEDGMYSFSSPQDLLNLRNVTDFPIVLDWSIGEQTCQQVGDSKICGLNTECSDSITRAGYNCKCKTGYIGNPYLPEGCQGNLILFFCFFKLIVFLKHFLLHIHKHNCLDSSTCENTMGHFLVIALRPEYYVWTQIFLGTTIGFLVILLVVSCVQKKMKHMKNTELRKHFFEQNGGGMLRQRLSGAGPSNIDVKIFTEEGMKEATNGYDESRILGQGGQGTVYKETEVPLLVYEFINSGTLFDHLHGSLFDSSLTWEHRLRIAVEIAGTLAYLHSSASIPIIHRDVKTANILLDENLTAKVADFGASRLIPMDKEQLTTMVQGTLGYLDPEYYNTGLLNEKSDVYSFGVVLMELLSGQKALCFDRPQTSKHLVSYFASAMKEKRLHEIIDGQVMNEDNQKAIQEVARIAVECTRLMGEERPRMKEVAAELEGLRGTKTKHKWSEQYPEPQEAEHLLRVEILSAQGDTNAIGYDSIMNVTRLHIEDGR
ncbi:BnaCnng71280D [Brassica napus]|uniref:BnaCnng71280D protein n=1 Tax=Brassica napus TaxID=3708 RepID=A0A078JU49_BRANA|nr:BnaCnng71280D [Brassica napus]